VLCICGGLSIVSYGRSISHIEALTAFPVKPWNITRVSLLILRLDIVLSYGDADEKLRARRRECPWTCRRPGHRRAQHFGEADMVTQSRPNLGSGGQ
jgi:hypothetical protein